MVGGFTLELATSLTSMMMAFLDVSLSLSLSLSHFAIEEKVLKILICPQNTKSTL
jgi:hypothetical protein